MTTSICPFTLAATKREDAGVVYETILPSSSKSGPTNGGENASDQAFGCGHSCTLTHLVQYLHDGGSSKSCPVCRTSRVCVVCDADSSAFLVQLNTTSEQNGNSNVGGGRIVSFRYGPISYFLWVRSSQQASPSSSRLNFFSNREENALDRIGSVLGMDVEKGLKVIHKGKVIYPDNKGGDDGSNDVSEQLLDISSADLIHRRKKPSLVVTGLRQPKTATVGNQRIANNLVLSIATRLSPRYIFSTVTWGFRGALHAAVSLLGGIHLFLRSILYPPPATHQ